MITLDDYKNNRNPHIMKAFKNEDSIQKAGEGSKGGKVIGHTKSGKPIYEHADHPSHSNYDKQDHSDAAILHNQKKGIIMKRLQKLQIINLKEIL